MLNIWDFVLSDQAMSNLHSKPCMRLQSELWFEQVGDKDAHMPTLASDSKESKYLAPI